MSLSEPREISMTWRCLSDGQPGPVRVELVEQSSDVTLVRVSHEMPGEPDDYRQGWGDMLERLGTTGG